MTGLDPGLQYDPHPVGIQSNRLVLKYGLRLIYMQYAIYSPMPYDAARETEGEQAVGLRESGVGASWTLPAGSFQLLSSPTRFDID